MFKILEKKQLTPDITLMRMDVEKEVNGVYESVIECDYASNKVCQCVKIKITKDLAEISEYMRSIYIFSIFCDFL